MIEALVVLAISGTALLLIFEIGLSGSQTGFRLGRRALAAADAEPGAGSLRTIIRGARFDIHSGGTATRQGPTGDSRLFATPASLDRETVCAPAGPAQGLRLALERTPEGDQLTCAAAAGDNAPSVVLIDFRPARAAFSYSEDATTWRDSWRRAAPPVERRLYVRLTSTDGAVDIIEQIDFAPPEPVLTLPTETSGAAL